jgi:hypothetical protein
VVTEKIDGTNAGIRVTEDGECWAQSRKRLITANDDNYGFAAWVLDNHDYLASALGPGMHFGEWWGRGIQRGYGQQDRIFSLFNTSRWENVSFVLPTLRVVPVLYQGPFSEVNIRLAFRTLEVSGSEAAPGFMRPEGVVVFHVAANQTFKALLVNDNVPKGRAA